LGLREGGAADAEPIIYGECTQAVLKHSYALNFTCPLARGLYYRCTAHMRLTDESYPGSLTLSESKWPSSIGGLREAVGGNKSKRCKAVSTEKVQNDIY